MAGFQKLVKFRGTKTVKRMEKKEQKKTTTGSYSYTKLGNRGHKSICYSLG